MLRVVLCLILIGFNLTSLGQDAVLSNFYAIQFDKKAVLNWTVETGSICNGITIYHSLDSIDYTEIGHIEGICGSSQEALKYYHTHEEPLLNQFNYYKLRLGFTQFSEVISLRPTYVEPGTMQLAPNPVSDIIKIAVNKEQKSLQVLKVFNQMGLLVFTQSILPVDTFEIDVSNLSIGIYTIVLEGDDEIIQNKFIKK